MYYVYLLSFNNLTFYVGCSSNPLKRYLQHCSCNGWYTKNIIYPKIKNGIYPDFKIIYHNEDKYDAKEKEKNVVERFASCGHYLSNLEFNPIDNRIGINELDDCKIKLPRNYYNNVKEYLDQYNSVMQQIDDVDFSEIGIKNGSYSGYGIWERTKSTLYQQAKKAVSTLELNQMVISSENNRQRLCTYLRQNSAGTNKKFTTKRIKGQLMVIRIK